MVCYDLCDNYRLWLLLMIYKTIQIRFRLEDTTLMKGIYLKQTQSYIVLATFLLIALSCGQTDNFISEVKELEVSENPLSESAYLDLGQGFSVAITRDRDYRWRVF